MEGNYHEDVRRYERRSWKIKASQWTFFKKIKTWSVSREHFKIWKFITVCMIIWLNYFSKYRSFKFLTTLLIWSRKINSQHLSQAMINDWLQCTAGSIYSTLTCYRVWVFTSRPSKHYYSGPSRPSTMKMTAYSSFLAINLVREVTRLWQSGLPWRTSGS